MREVLRLIIADSLAAQVPLHTRRRGVRGLSLHARRQRPGG